MDNIQYRVLEGHWNRKGNNLFFCFWGVFPVSRLLEGRVWETFQEKISWTPESMSSGKLISETPLQISPLSMEHHCSLSNVVWTLTLRGGLEQVFYVVLFLALTLDEI